MNRFQGTRPLHRGRRARICRAGIEVAKRKGIYKAAAMQLRAKGLTIAEIATALGIRSRDSRFSCQASASYPASFLEQRMTLPTT